jgi:putative transcriptional regulator
MRRNVRNVRACVKTTQLRTPRDRCTILYMSKASTLGSRIAGVRRTRKVPQESLADFCGISAKHLSAIENDRSNPSLDVLEKIARGIDISVDYLLLGKGAP